jgi:hypothetical protein
VLHRFGLRGVGIHPDAEQGAALRGANVDGDPVVWRISVDVIEKERGTAFLECNLRNRPDLVIQSSMANALEIAQAIQPIQKTAQIEHHRSSSVFL